MFTRFARKAEVNQLYFAQIVVVCNHHVLRLDVSMDHVACFVQRLQGRKNTSHHGSRIRLCQSLASRVRAQSLKAKFHLHDKILIIEDVLLWHVDNVFMPKYSGQHLILFLEHQRRLRRL